MKKVYARNCQIRGISPIEGRSFLIENHDHGAVRSIQYYGTFDGDCLVQVLSIRRYRGIQFNWEVARFASLRDHQVLGGLSKLMSAVTRDFGGEIGFAIFDDEFDGHSMIPSGFRFVKQVKSQTDHPTVSYYRWGRPNTELYYGYVYKNTYEDQSFYIGSHCFPGIEIDPNYIGSPSDTDHGIPIKIEILDRGVDQATLKYRESYWIEKNIQKTGCINKPQSLHFLGISPKPFLSSQQIRERSKVWSEAARKSHQQNPRKIGPETNIKTWSDPVIRRARIDGIKRANLNESTKKKHSEASVNGWKNGIHTKSSVSEGAKKRSAKRTHETIVNAALLAVQRIKEKDSEFYSRRTSLRNIGRHWFTNGTENKFCKECPEGFSPGLTKKSMI